SFAAHPARAQGCAHDLCGRFRPWLCTGDVRLQAEVLALRHQLASSSPSSTLAADGPFPRTPLQIAIASQKQPAVTSRPWPTRITGLPKNCGMYSAKESPNSAPLHLGSVPDLQTAAAATIPPMPSSSSPGMNRKAPGP